MPLNKETKQNHYYSGLYIAIQAGDGKCESYSINKVNIAEGIVNRNHYLQLHLFQGN